MIQTSYYGNHRHFPKGKRLVSISRFNPSAGILHALELAPSESLLADYKNGNLSEEEYKERYLNETLSLLNPDEVAKKYKNKILLCFEKSDDFCHRHILAEWLISHGHNVEEFQNEISIAVVGSRGFKDYAYFKKIMDALTANYPLCRYVSGGAEGADLFIEQYASERGEEVTVHLPDWNKGKSAGFIRNTKLWHDGDIGIAFWDSSSRGTSHSFGIAKKQNKKLYIVEYNKGSISTQFQDTYSPLVGTKRETPLPSQNAPTQNLFSL